MSNKKGDYVVDGGVGVVVVGVVGVVRFFLINLVLKEQKGEDK